MRKVLIGVVSAVVATVAVATASVVGGDRPVSSDDPGQSASRDAVMGTVTGVVTRGAAPVVGAAVLPRSLDDPSQPIPELAVETDADGRYSWRLRPGRYELAVHEGEGEAVVTRPVTVTAGETATLDITLR